MTPQSRGKTPESTTAKAPKSQPCGACGRGFFQAADVRGRRFSHRDARDLELSESLIVPACSACGEIRLDDAGLHRMDEALERAYRARRQ